MGVSIVPQEVVMVVAVKFANSVTQIENTQSKSKNKCYWENAIGKRAKAAKAFA